MTKPDPQLAQLQEEAGGVMTDAATAAPRVAHFGDPGAEYRAARTNAVIFDLSDRAQIELAGVDRQKFLHNFCTNDIKSLNPGQGCEAFVTNVKGKVLAHIFVFAGAERLMLDTVPGASDALLAHLDRYLIREDVQLQDRSDERGELFVSGAEATHYVGRIDEAVQSLSLYEHVITQFQTDPLAIRRVDWLDQPGYLLCISKVRLADLWKSLIRGAAGGSMSQDQPVFVAGVPQINGFDDSGSWSGLRPAGSDAYHALRIEAGMPHYGQDIHDDNLAQEVARTELAISFTKGCYLGQEPIARIDAIGHVNRELRRLRIMSPPVPASGTPVLSAGDDAVQVGWVTSSALSFEDQKPVALAYLRSNVANPGTRLRIPAGSSLVDASVF